MGDASADIIVEGRFAIVPEWLLDADISDVAVRLYAVLLRYGNSSGARMPSRRTLASRLRKRSTDSVDRAMKELVAIGAVRVEHRYDGSQRLTNAYHLRTSRPGRAGSPTADDRGSCQSAATRKLSVTGGRTDVVTVAAGFGDDRKHLTDSNSSSVPDPAANEGTANDVNRDDAGNSPESEIATDCGVEDWSSFVAQVQTTRREAGAAVTRWAGPCLSAALQLAVNGRGWPAEVAADALLRVAADPATKSPMRLAEPGPWWDERPLDQGGPDLDAMAQELLEADGVRVQLQLRARRDLEAQGLPVTRAAVIRGAYRLLTQPDTGPGAA